MKKLFTLLAVIAIAMAGTINSAAALPDITTGEENVASVGKVKYTKSDIFTTELNGEPVEMSIIYTIPLKNQPAFTVEIFSKNSQIYKDIEAYLNKLTEVAPHFKYTGSRISDIFATGDEYTWCTAQQYGVAGSSLGMVNKTIDDVRGTTEDTYSITIPLGVMDSNRYDWNNKNHWKDFQKAITTGHITSLRYKFINPLTGKDVQFILPVNAEMSLTMNKLVEVYNKK